MPGSPWSFDALHLAGAHGRPSARGPTSPRSSKHALSTLESPTVGIDLLERFLRHPVRAFLRERLHISLRDRTRDLEDAIPVDLGGLEEWHIAERMLEARLGGATPEACEAVEIARGGLPPGTLAAPVLQRISTPLDELVAAGQSPLAPTSLDVHVDLSGSCSLVGTVPEVRRGRGAHGHLLETRASPPPDRMVTPAGAHGYLAGSSVRGPHHRPLP